MEGQHTHTNSMLELITAGLTLFILLMNRGKKMEKKDIELGAGFKLDVKVAEGKLVLSVAAVDGAVMNELKVDIDMLVEKLVAATDNKIDDALGAVLKAALKQA